MRRVITIELMVVVLSFVYVSVLFPLENRGSSVLDNKVKAFLQSHAGNWDDTTFPETDGKLLYDIIVKNGYTKALEIGTSSGHSAIWIGWALSKTGGKLITVEIDELRHKRALENFKEAGLSEFIDARLADAHQLVPRLVGPFDFVLCDAETDWYRYYFDAVAPKMKVGGCYATHDVSDGYLRLGKRVIKDVIKSLIGGGWHRIRRDLESRSYVDHLKGVKNFETIFDYRGAGVALSYKKSEN